MIVQFKNSFGNSLLRNHLNKSGVKISLYCQNFHTNGCYPVYRIIFENRIKTYHNKTLNQIVGILKRMGY